MSKRKGKDRPFNNPFVERKKELERLAKRAEPPPPRPPPEPEVKVESDEDLFAHAMSGAARLADDPRGIIRPPLPPADAGHVRLYDEDAEVYEELLDLVEGRTSFDISDTDEYIEGCVEGLDRRILQRLRRGDFTFRAHLDLHGMMRTDAREAVERFIVEKRREGERCVLIVHGRGKNSKDNIPILKGLLKSWLERGRIAKSVLAFATARPHDGGAGAVYVLLRR